MLINCFTVPSEYKSLPRLKENCSKSKTFTFWWSAGLVLSDKATTDRDDIEVLIMYGVIRAESKGEQMPCVCDIRSLNEYMKLNYWLVLNKLQCNTCDKRTSLFYVTWKNQEFQTVCLRKSTLIKRKIYQMFI